MDEISNKNHVDEFYFYKSMVYIEELVSEFGNLHPLVEKTMEGFLRKVIDETFFEQKFM